NRNDDENGNVGGNGNGNGGGNGNGNGGGNGNDNEGGNRNENPNRIDRGVMPVAQRYQVKYATCTLLNSALTWWNAHKRTIRADDAFAMSWRELMRVMTEVYCLRNEIQKMEYELWNLTVKNNDLAAYTQRFQELTKMCTKMVLDGEDRVKKFIGGLPDNI
ncbi:reverse transcriptase domain-containing protein, partial [Tanacetum coccineum]